MTTFMNDFIKIPDLDCGGESVMIPCVVLDLQWPPPETLEIGGHKFRRVRYSQLTDEQREEMPMIVRGAQYEVNEATDEA